MDGITNSQPTDAIEVSYNIANYLGTEPCFPGASGGSTDQAICAR